MPAGTVAGEGELAARVAVLALEDHAADGFREVGVLDPVHDHFGDRHLAFGVFRAGFVVDGLGKAVDFRLLVLGQAQVLGGKVGEARQDPAIPFPERNGFQAQFGRLVEGVGYRLHDGAGVDLVGEGDEFHVRLRGRKRLGELDSVGPVGFLKLLNFKALANKRSAKSEHSRTDADHRGPLPGLTSFHVRHCRPPS